MSPSLFASKSRVMSHGSHSVTCHPTAVTPAEAGTRLSNPAVDLGIIYQDSLPTKDDILSQK